MDIHFPILLTLEEAAQGVERDFLYASPEVLCPACAGTGQAGGVPCAECDASGRGFIPRRFTVAIPAGANDQVRIRITGQGPRLRDGSGWGDLYLICYLRPHAHLQRQGFDLVGDGAARDGRLTVQTLAGPLDVQIPEGFDGASFRLPALGLPRRIGGGDRGDLIVRLLQGPPAETARQFKMARAQARSCAHDNPVAVVELLCRAEFEGLHDAETHALAGIACARVGRSQDAPRHLHGAAEKEPANPLHSYNLGLLAMQAQDPLTAAAWFESSLRRDALRQQTRQALVHAVRRLFQQSATGASPQAAAVLQDAGAQAERRMYAAAAAVLHKGAQGNPAFTWIEACTRLLACCAGNENLAAEAAQLFETAEALWPDVPALRRGRQTLLQFAERDCGLLGLLALAYYESSRGRFDVASRLAIKAVERARFDMEPGRRANSTDPIDSVEEDHLQRWLYSLIALLRREGSETPCVAFLDGLIAQVECYCALRRSSQVDSGWGPALRAVRQTEIALSQSPDDLQVVEQFQQSLDLFGGIAGALLNNMNPDLVEFVQNTYDAALQNLIPESPFNRVVTPGAPIEIVRGACEDAFTRLFSSTRKPLRGEFLVASAQEHFVLTNYRLHLYTDRLAAPQLLPLNVIHRYAARSEGLTVSTLLLALTEGQQLALNGLPNGCYPRDSLVNYLIAARMWERLQTSEQQVLETGHADTLALAGREEVLALPGGPRAEGTGAPAASLAAPGAALLPESQGSQCPHCGKATRAQDVFCRQCGARLAAESVTSEDRLLESRG